MEHRIGRRKTIYGHIELWQDDVKCGDFELANIGAGGLFIKCGRMELGEGEIYTIKPHFGKQFSIDGYYLKAMVVYQSDQGVGMMWAGCQANFLDNLEMALNRAA